MREGCIQNGAPLLAAAAIAAGYQKTAIGEIEKPFRLGARLEMPGDRASTIPSHCGGPVMIAADAERHALGGTAGELRMQQCVELLAVTGGKRGVKRAGEIVRADFFHPDDPPCKFAVLAAERENPLEAARRRCYYSNGQSDYF
jgi:hypothetical protein